MSMSFPCRSRVGRLPTSGLLRRATLLRFHRCGCFSSVRDLSLTQDVVNVHVVSLQVAGRPIADVRATTACNPPPVPSMRLFQLRTRPVSYPRCCECPCRFLAGRGSADCRRQGYYGVQPSSGSIDAVVSAPYETCLLPKML